MTLNCNLVQLLSGRDPQFFLAPAVGLHWYAPIGSTEEEFIVERPYASSPRANEGVGVHPPASWSACRAQVIGTASLISSPGFRACGKGAGRPYWKSGKTKTTLGHSLTWLSSPNSSSTTSWAICHSCKPLVSYCLFTSYLARFGADIRLLAEQIPTGCVIA